MNADIAFFSCSVGGGEGGFGFSVLGVSLERPAPTPEPSTLALAALGILALSVCVWWRRWPPTVSIVSHLALVATFSVPQDARGQIYAETRNATTTTTQLSEFALDGTAINPSLATKYNMEGMAYFNGELFVGGIDWGVAASASHLGFQHLLDFAGRHAALDHLHLQAGFHLVQLRAAKMPDHRLGNASQDGHQAQSQSAQPEKLAPVKSR